MRIPFPLACLLFILFLLVIIASAFAVNRANAHDSKHAELDSWYPTLRSGKGPCCDGPGKDAVHLDDLDWETTGDIENPYRVHLPGNKEWMLVPKSAVVDAQNKDGRALAWPFYQNGEMTVRCFLPGSMT